MNNKNMIKKTIKIFFGTLGLYLLAIGFEHIFDFFPEKDGIGYLNTAIYIPYVKGTQSSFSDREVYTYTYPDMHDPDRYFYFKANKDEINRFLEERKIQPTLNKKIHTGPIWFTPSEKSDFYTWGKHIDYFLWYDPETEESYLRVWGKAPF